MIRIKFWWHGIIPSKFLSDFSYHDSRDFQVSTDGGRTWRLPKPGQTIRNVCDWMIDHDKTIVAEELIHRKSRPTWRGLYVLQIA